MITLSDSGRTHSALQHAHLHSAARATGVTGITRTKPSFGAGKDDRESLTSPSSFETREMILKRASDVLWTYRKAISNV